MAVKLVQTAISETAISMRYADDPNDPAKAQTCIEFQVPLEALKLPSDRNKPLVKVESQLLAVVQQAALLYVRDAIVEEIHGLAGLAGHWS
jgi:hypothetical protein